MSTPPEDEDRVNVPQHHEDVSTTEVDDSRVDSEASPGGLLGLLLWPLQAALGFGLQLAGNLIAGILSGLLGNSSSSEEE